MNVLKYLIEISTIPKKTKKMSIYEVIVDCLENDQSFDGDNYKSAIEDEWNKLSHDAIKTINSPKYLLGGFEKNGIRIFIFEKRKDGLKNKNNLTLEVLSFADLPAEKILNDSFGKISSVLTKLKTKYIDDSQILIYPYDTQRKDIWSPEMMIKADIISPFSFDKKLIARWILIGLLTIILGILFFTTESDPAVINKETNEIEGGSDLKNIYSSLMLSGIFYILLELVIHLIIPYFFSKQKKNIQVKNLSSIVDKVDPFTSVTEEKEVLSNPNTDVQ